MQASITCTGFAAAPDPIGRAGAPMVVELAVNVAHRIGCAMPRRETLRSSV